MSPFLRGGKAGRKGSGAVGWRGKRWEAMGSQPGNRDAGPGEACGETGWGAAVKPTPGGGGGDVLAGASNQISLMKWGYIVKPIGAETTGILPCVS